MATSMLQPRLDRTGPEHAHTSTETLSSPHNRNDQSHSFTGAGLQNIGGSTSVGRDLNIQNFNIQLGQRIQEDEKRKVLLQSLHFDQMDARQWYIKRNFPYTCEWILETPVYANWKLSSGFLWLKGKPGTGKSTLMKFLQVQLQNEIRTSQSNSPDLLISFFFNARGHNLEKTTEGLYRSLLVQLFEKRSDVQCVLEKIRIGHEWTVESLKFLFEEVIQGLGSSRVICLIDALDECDEEQVRDMVSFLNNISIRSTNPQISVCLASRHYPHITIATETSLIIEDQIGHSEDITSYLNKALRIGDGEIAEQIRNELRRKASGVFIWVALVVAILNKEYDAGRVHNLHAQVHGLPRDLYQLFYEIFAHDSHSSVHNSNDIFLCVQWILFAWKPLTPKELYLAIICGEEPEFLTHCHLTNNFTDITYDTIERYIIHCSKGLAKTTKSMLSTVQFYHESVPDFLLRENGIERIWPEYSLGRSHDTLKKSCMTYIEMEALETLERRPPEQNLVKFPFLEYAHHGILYHASRAQSNGVSQREFLASFPQSIWVKCHNTIQRYRESLNRIRRGTYHMSRYKAEVSLLYILAEAGMPILIREYTNRQSCFAYENERYGAPILAACAANHTTSVQVMLELQAERLPGFSDISSNPHRSYPDHAFPFKSEDLFHRLIEYGNEPVSVFFLETEGVDVSHSGENGWTPLHHASFAGRSTIARLLISEGAIVSVPNEDGCTPLHYAAKGQIETVKILLEAGAEISTIDKIGRTPLHYAAYLGKTEVVKMLVTHGADVQSSDSLGFIPLNTALDRGYLDVAQLLIRYGADVSAVIKDGYTLLHLTAYKGYTEIGELLIEYGADISAIFLSRLH
ncbi:hypothetical protein F5Y16DRAFT_424790 [Xylariaceae sp. FL0255]|nr:hypothetical protein F5Y16DRAFT_424790 [Xylariaceae sp. FL0255]